MEIKGKIIRKTFLMPPHPLTNFEIQKYCQNQPTITLDFMRNSAQREKFNFYFSRVFF